MNVRIHRGAHQIGGSCIEISTQGQRLIIDVGLPLDADSSEAQAAFPPAKGLFQHEERDSAIIGVLISHPHQDHYGLLHSVHPQIPVYTTVAGQLLMESGFLLSGVKHPTHWAYFESFKTFQVGIFQVTPYLVDHSAFDACAFLVEVEGKRVFYSGDFRAHGRKRNLFSRMISHPPHAIDLLLMEGTMLGRTGEIVKSEEDLETEFIAEINKCPGTVLCTVSSQNIDRIVSIYRAAMQTNRVLCLDLYTAIMLERIHSFAKIPYPSDSYANLKVWYPWRLSTLLAKNHGPEILYQFRPWKVERDSIHENPERYIILTKPSYASDIEKMDLHCGLYLYSQWKGYSCQPREQAFREMLIQRDFRVHHIHTSGHATRDDLRRLVKALSPSILIPIHTEKPEEFEGLGGVPRIVHDGELIQL